jgi:hypothetical protein
MLDDSSIPVLHDNAPPVDITPAFMRARIQIEGRTRVSAGVARYRTDGTLQIELNVAATKGDGASLDLAQSLIELFTDARVNDLLLKFRVGSVVGAPEIVDHWYRRSIAIPFQFDEVVS